MWRDVGQDEGRVVRSVGELGVSCRDHVPAVVAAVLVVGKLRLEELRKGLFLSKVAVPFSMSSFPCGLCSGDRGRRQVLGNPKGNSVASVPSKHVALAKEYVFVGVGRKTVLANDFLCTMLQYCFTCGMVPPTLPYSYVAADGATGCALDSEF